MAIEAADAYAGDYDAAEETGPDLFTLLQSPNVAEVLDDDMLGNLGAKVVREFEIDDNSRKDWLTKIEGAIDLAMQVAEEKSYPWPRAANVKYPLMTTAAIQFAARAYPAIVAGNNIVKSKLVGEHTDEKREKADRVATHMSWQMSEEMEEWDEDTDKLLHILPIVGCVLRKTWFDPDKGRNCSRLVHPKKGVVNYNAVSLADAPRITEVLEFYPYQITEKRRLGTWRDIDLPLTVGEDEDAPHEFLEQHRMLDLDEDGYEEPWIVTVHKESAKVVRIVPRFDEMRIIQNARGEIAKIDPIHYYTKYSFLPSPDGSFYDVGFGMLLSPINETINASINQMLDAGHLQNVGGGFINNSLKLKGGALRFKPGEWKQVDMTGGVTNPVIPIPHPGPSVVLFSLLELLLQAGKDISAVQDVLTGEQGANEPATTTLARIEQGLKVFTAIYKRIFRALKGELGKLFDLNAQYLNPDTYYTVLDEQQQIGPEDYDRSSFDVVPVADPSSVSDMQKLARAQFLMEFIQDPAVNGMEIRRRIFEAAGVDDLDELFDVQPPQPPPEMVKIMADVEHDGQRLALEAAKMEADIAEIESRIILNLAKAEGEESGPQIDLYKSQMKEITDRVKAYAQLEQGRLRAMAGTSGDGGGAPVSQGLRGAGPGGMGAGQPVDGGIPPVG